MPWFRRPPASLPTQQPQPVEPSVSQERGIEAEIRDRTYQDVRDNVDKCLTKFCKDIGMMPKDVRHRLLNYDAQRKVWQKMAMKTIYKVYNDPDKLSLIIYLDTRMTEEEERMIDAMSLRELVDFCNSESPKRLSGFFKDKRTMTQEELAARAKFELRLSAEEIKARGTYANMARYWCKVRPEVFSTLSRTDLMRLYKD